jgi:hypothetical protein
MVKSIKRSQSDEKRLRNRENVMMKFTN